MLIPKCIKNNKEFGHSSQGYLLPCCWCDNHFKSMSDPVFNALFDEELKLTNVNNISDILLSDQWLAFEQAINGDIKNAPQICKEKCESLSNTKVIEINPI